MKKKDYIIFFGLSFVIHLIITPIFLLVNRMVICHWDGVLPGEPLPVLTNFALLFGYVWPCVFLILHLISFILSFKIEKEKIMTYTQFVYLLEIIVLTVIVFGYIMPEFGITHRLG